MKGRGSGIPSKDDIKAAAERQWEGVDPEIRELMEYSPYLSKGSAEAVVNERRELEAYNETMDSFIANIEECKSIEELKELILEMANYLRKENKI